MKIFISGYSLINEEQFKEEYKDKIKFAIDKGYSFMVGDLEGIDKMAQEYLFKKNYQNVLICHVGKKPKYNLGNWETLGGFKRESDKDVYMIWNTNNDILYI